MPRLPLTALLAVPLLAAAAAAADQGPYPETEAALQAEHARLNWIEKPGTYTLPRSGSTVTLAAGLSLLLGDEAERKLFLMNGTESPQVEAVLWDRKDDVIVVYEYFGEGFVKAGLAAAESLPPEEVGTELRALLRRPRHTEGARAS